jgi:hypothetical protein
MRTPFDCPRTAPPQNGSPPNNGDEVPQNGEAIPADPAPRDNPHAFIPGRISLATLEKKAASKRERNYSLPYPNHSPTLCLMPKSTKKREPCDPPGSGPRANTTGNRLHSLRTRLWVISILTVLAIWASLYLPHLSTSPRWYGDETITIACGHDLVKGVFSNRSTWNTYINPQFCYQPGYVAIVGGLSWLGGKDILLPRLFNTLLALFIAVSGLVVLGRRSGMTLGTLVALTFLAYMQSVIHFRWVYAHNAVAAGFFFCLVLLTARRSPRREWLAGFGLGLAAIAHPLAIYGGLPAWLARWNKPSSWIRLFLPPLVLGLLVIAPIVFRYPSWFFEDVRHLGNYYRMYSEQNGSGIQSIQNFWTFLNQDIFHLLAALAAVFTLFTRLRILAIGALFFIALLTSNRQNLTVFYYQAIIALPLLSACLAYAVWRLSKRLTGQKLLQRWLPFCLPLIMLTQTLPPSLKGNLVSRNDRWVTQSIDDLRSTVNWVNDNTTPDDLVLAHWNTGWLLDCRTADLLQATAWGGWPTHTFEHSVPHERFRYSLSPQSVKYLILGDIDFNWTIHNDNVGAWITQADVEKWPIVYRTPTYLVLKNPKHQ